MTVRMLMGAAALAVALSGCGKGFNVREAVGLDKNPPDAFAVITKKPLEKPTDFASLPTPQPGAPSLVDPRPKEEAAKALFGSAAPAAMAAAPAQQSPTDLLLLNAAAPADPDVRAVVTTENAANAKPTYLLDELAPGLKALRGETGDSVDPLAETNRLRALRGLPPIMPVASAQ